MKIFPQYTKTPICVWIFFYFEFYRLIKKLKLWQLCWQTPGCIDGLDELVEVGVINKPQANTINQKIQIDMKHIMESN